MSAWIILTTTFIALFAKGISKDIRYKYIPSCKLQTSTNNKPFKTQASVWMLDCVRECSNDSNCLSATFDQISQGCNLFSNADVFCSKSSKSHVSVLKVDIDCFNNGSFDELSHKCICYNGFIGDICENIMTDCFEGYKSGNYNKDIRGIYFIKPRLSSQHFAVQCNMKVGGTYIMKNSFFYNEIQRNLSWAEYRSGFGADLTIDNWIGLEKIHLITSNRPQHLYVEIIASTNNWEGRWRKYENFKVEDESTNYRMTYSGSSPWSQSNVDADPDWNEPIANTPLGDSMVGLNGSAFSTYDRDNDQDAGRNCAQDYQGGWWFNACADCNPNGPMKSARNTSAVDELFWKNYYMQLAIVYIEMMFRAT